MSYSVGDYRCPKHGWSHGTCMPCTWDMIGELQDTVTKQREEIEALRNLMWDLSGHEHEKCRLDHHGGCQEHGYINLRPGEVCPVHEFYERVKVWKQEGWHEKG